MIALPPWRPLAGAVAATALVTALAVATALADEPAGIDRLAGRLEWSERLAARWPMCGTWMYPVGDSLDFERPYRGRPGFQVSRGVQSGTDAERHTGADLRNGHAGGTVRAAAHGLVAFVDRAGSGGYGLHVVLAHRLEDGDLVYSVYSHLGPGTIRVRPGQVVRAGHRLGRVGRSGRATTNHLHFEVRRPDDPDVRWEHARVVDPIAFIAERRMRETPEDDPAAPYLTWAEWGALLPEDVDPDRPLDAKTWRHMRSRSAGLDAEAPEDAADSRRSSGRIEWKELSRDLKSLRESGTALAPCAVNASRHASRCRERFGTAAPARGHERLATRPGTPTVRDACVLLADLVVPPPETPSRSRRRRDSGPANGDAARDTTPSGVAGGVEPGRP